MARDLSREAAVRRAVGTMQRPSASRGGACCGRLGLLVAMGFALLLAGCESAAPPRVSPQREPGEPTVRVRIEQASEQVTITAPSRVRVHAEGGAQRSQLLSTPLTLRRVAGQWSGPWTGHAPDGEATVVVEPLGPAPLALDEVRYPGTLHLVPVFNGGDASDSPMDVINHTGLEAYLPGVLERELYADWQPATFLAQAIAARSFAIHRIVHHGPSRHFDLESTTVSQVYGGYATHPLASRAVADTSGLVLTFDGEVLPAYYSSTCGGAGQSATEAFGGSNAPAPLVPRRPCSWCSFSPHADWGPVVRDRAELGRRIRAWGRHHELSLGQMGQLVSIRAAETNRVGRPVRFELVDDAQRRYLLRAESLRFAANFNGEGLEPVPPAQRLRSGFFEVTAERDGIRFSNGRGFGHGVGLCQFGTEGMARAGHGPLAVLDHFYPGAKVVRAY